MTAPLAHRPGAALTGLVGLCLLLPTAALAQAPRLSENAARGRTVAEWRCSPCHATGTEAASPSPQAPRFVDLTKRYAPSALERRLTGYVGGQHLVMPPPDLNVDEALVIAAYIESLRRPSGDARP